METLNLSEFICIVEGKKYHIFEDYLVSLNITIRFYPCKILKGEKIIVVQELLNLNYEDASFIGYLNMEQLTTKEWTNKFKNNILSTKLPLHIFDYSASNIKYMEENFGVSAIHLPYQYREKEINLLKELINDTPKEYDLAFIGSLCNDRRTLIVKNLLSVGLKINLIQGWNLVRDKEIAKCKALLNLHFKEEFQIFEEMRCNRWLASGLTVISEPSYYDCKIKEQFENLTIFNPNDFLFNVQKYFNNCTKKLKIGVAIPTWKKDLIWLKRCLDSIEKQILKPNIVCISASSCLDEDIPNYNYSFQLKIIVTAQKQNAALNRNIAASYIEDVDIITFFDSDDEMIPERLLYIERSLRESNNHFVMHDCLEIKSFNQHYNIEREDYKSHVNGIIDNPTHCGVKKYDNVEGGITHGHISVLYDIFQKEKFQIEDKYIYWEDAEYAKRLIKGGYKGDYIQNKLSVYHNYEGSFETFHNLAREARINSKHLDCYNYCQEALLLSNDKNEWLIYYELSIIAFYTKYKNQGKYFSNKVITSPNADKVIVEQVKKNLVYYA